MKKCALKPCIYDTRCPIECQQKIAKIRPFLKRVVYHFFHLYPESYLTPHLLCLVTMKFIKQFSEITISDVGLVGGKTASLGYMYSRLSSHGVKVPNGFAITADAYWHFVNANGLMPHIEKMMDDIHDFADLDKIHKVGHLIRNLFHIAPMPADLAEEIYAAYHGLAKEYQQKNIHVAVRSSATAEDLPSASFAGQQESYLNISGKDELIDACKKCFASLFTDRAMVYRNDKGFDYKKIALSIAVQKMVRSDKASSGVAFSLDTESGFKDVVVINASYGLGQAIVQGLVVPDEYIVFKPTLRDDLKPIISKKRGSKQIKIVYKPKGTMQTAVPAAQQEQFCLTDDEILELTKSVCAIEKLYTDQKGSWCPMDVEWAKDGIDNMLYIVQARPETVHAQEKGLSYTNYTFTDTSKIKVLAHGQSIGQQIVSGKVCHLESIREADKVEKGDIIVTRMTDPDWVPLLKKAAGIITQMGGRTCHAAIVSRELGIPALVGVHDAMSILHNGQTITIDCSQGITGYVYEGAVAYEKKEILLDVLPKPPVQLLMNLADPERAFALSFLPVDGIGLARIEFIITNTIKIHPLALLYPEIVTDKKMVRQINEITAGYADKKEFYIDTLAQGIATIAAAFFPRPVIVRTSDFKTNEYSNLLGGQYFEPHEENPMIGFRGAIRYCADRYKHAFALECSALKKAREIMGLTNIKVMIPFVRTLAEGKKVIEEMATNNLIQKQHDLSIIMMCEVPSNVMLIDEFLQDFDGISIGSNDLTQLTLGVDRDSPLLAGVFDERDPAMKKMFELAIAGAKRAGKYSGICGQAPSDYPELADFLIELGIESVSLNPDAIVPFLMRYKK